MNVEEFPTNPRDVDMFKFNIKKVSLEGTVSLELRYTFNNPEEKQIYDSITVKQGLADTHFAFPKDVEITLNKEYIRREFLNCMVDRTSWTNRIPRFRA